MEIAGVECVRFAYGLRMAGVCRLRGAMDVADIGRAVAIAGKIPPDPMSKGPPR